MLERRNLLVATLAAVLSACGGGSDPVAPGGDNDDDGAGNPPPVTTTGVFADSVVAGIGYRTATQEGVTNAAGEFEYVDGETVVFFIGDLELPAVAASALVTPLDVFATDDFADRRVVNLARLLQSVDQDGNPDNGIAIAATAAVAATGFMLDFDVTTDDFAANVNVINFVSAAGGTGTLVSAVDALAHLKQLSIVGSWYIFDPNWDVDPADNDSMTIVLMADGTYMEAEGTAFVPGDPGVPGIEYGTYTWNPLTGEMEVDVEFDSNNTWGLSHFDPSIARSGDTISIPYPDASLDELGEGQAFMYALAVDAENPLVGGWKAEIPDEAGQVIVMLFTGEQYSYAEFQSVGPEGIARDEVGGEFGTYTWNEQSGEFIAVPRIDHNGDWGPSHGGQMTVVVDGDTLTLTAEDGQVVTFTRVM
jgi:hypothetical protein